MWERSRSQSLRRPTYGKNRLFSPARVLGRGAGVSFNMYMSKCYALTACGARDAGESDFSYGWHAGD